MNTNTYKCSCGGDQKTMAQTLIRKIKFMGQGTDTLPGFEEWDRGHIETIARRLGVILLSQLESKLFIQMTSNDPLFTLTGLMASFSTRSGDDSDDVRITAINPDNHGGNQELAYFIALHELGHQALMHQDGLHGNRDTIFQNECAAWDWAFTHANRWPKDETICEILDLLSTYTYEETGKAY